MTTQVVVRTELLTSHPEAVAALIHEHDEITRWTREHPEEAQRVVRAGIARITGKELSSELVAAAWKNLEFTTDLLPDTVRSNAAAAEELGLLKLRGLSLDGLWTQ
jgi:NitT/TauT family transport system substrate-binding protein